MFNIAELLFKRPGYTKSNTISNESTKNMNSAAFYKPLDVSRREVRLLRIISSDQGVIICKLEHAYLDDNPSFAALSYVWGDATITQDITVNGNTFAATKNLAAALAHALDAWTWSIPSRDPDTFRLWVDAICINQNDYAERNSQVQLMASIYQGAEVVLSWLGPDEADLVYCLDILMLIYTETKDLAEEEFSSLKWMKKHPSLCLKGPDTTKGMLGNRAWSAVSSLLDRPYFSRVWILQEIALARRLTFFTPSRVVDYGILEPVWNTWTKLQSVVSAAKFHRPDGIDESVLFFIGGNYWDWSSWHRIKAAKMLVNFPKVGENDISHKAYGWALSFFGRALKATNPKDHIYGLMALTNIEMIPDYDYKTTVGEVYSQYIATWLRLCAKHHQDIKPFEEYAGKPKLFFLVDSGIGDFENKFCLPSWAPNFPEESQTYVNSKFVKGNSDARLFTSRLGMPHVEANTLFVTGIQVDKISDMANVCSESMWRDRSALEYLTKFASRNKLYKTKGITALQAILMTLKQECRRSDTTENDLFFAFHFLEFILRPDFEYVHENLESLNIDWGVFNEDFPAAIGSNYDGPQPNWKDGFFEKSAKVRAEFHHQSLGAVIRACVSLKNGKRFFESSKGYFGLCPTNSLPGDSIAILNGCGSPVVLRRNGDHYIHVGTCFVTGLMDGEAAENVEEEGCAIEEICLR